METVWMLLKRSIDSTDETEFDLAKDLLLAAYKYTAFRFNWLFYSCSQKCEDDDKRTSCHNRFIDCLNIYLRYICSKYPEHEALKNQVQEMNRKDIGDIANYIVYTAALSQR